MKALFVFFSILLISMQVYGQKYDYLEILRSYPPLPDNTLTASKAEKERWLEKLKPINELLWELEREQKKEQKRRENQPIPFELENMDKLDDAHEEWEKLYQQLADITMPIQMEEMEILNQNRQDQERLLEMSGSVYENRLKVQKGLDERNRKNLQEMRVAFEEVVPLVEKLDNFTCDGYPISSGTVGLSLLRDMYTSMTRAYSYNAGTGEEMDTIDAIRELNRMFGRE